ncbi:NADH-quinone oxidoreductase subunit NuoE [Modestobacter sp. VKM Ac-2986]|uniref:NADH-quinone oxidoreductase subunit NuoE n=1 Tax=Modestobacter sp. VKM Ac-2986 TaxID=3004140 RepID=UPI0022AB0715|nr:NADH-quinone oxidoreductase subunit NuoE [Modestobacter sp. VKM Ac-2986]MCZ2827941.1 NADH-quinone oxidoreductase subunit NuoE [Modestobacter sp. VKM Ac-2986]
MTALGSSREAEATTGLDAGPTAHVADLPPLTAQTEAEARELMARYPQPRSALLPMLHLVQSVQGYVSPEGVGFCARLLGLTKAEIGAVATFYTMFKRHPTGEHLVSVCTNTLCAVLGGKRIYDALSADLGVGHDQTTADGTITLEHAECLAACDHAPVVTVDYEFYDQQDVESARALVTALRMGEKPPPTRGAPLTDFRGVSRQLAGLSQHADAAAAQAAVDGPSAGVPTLVGVRLAAERGETAPPYDTPEPEPAPAPDVPTAGTTGETPAEQAADTAVAAAGNPAERAGAEQHHPDTPEPAGRQPAERGAEGTDRPATQGQAGSGTSVEREV